MVRTAELDVDRLSAMLKALSHPVRLEMVKRLAEAGDCQCIDLTRHFNLAQSTVSEHLKVLKDAGLVLQGGPSARAAYCLKKDALVWLKQAVVAL